MQIGTFIFATGYAMRIDDLAREVEARGFESLFVPEHTHIPTSRRSPWPGGADLPKEYWHTLDPYVSLMAAAAATTTLRVGTGITLLTERDPIVTAKEIASLDLLSNGRVEIGIGAGWNAEEMENHGTEFAKRFRVMSERAKAMKTLWSEEEPEFHGEFVDFDPVWSFPKPVQQPNPPILIGGESIHTLRRVVEYGDGWFPRARGGFDAAGNVDRLRAVADEAGRDMSTLSITVFGAPPDAAELASYREAGITRAVLALPSAPADTLLPLLDRRATLLSG
ncbi:MAG: LLM class F420-dependent oxidoreductase [Gammaproteobacteria bacterium]|nr:LLM class F420-dependent oxidoreductase [Gammaproteobacteria bacterium]